MMTFLAKMTVKEGREGDFVRLASHASDPGHEKIRGRLAKERRGGAARILQSPHKGASIETEFSIGIFEDTIGSQSEKWGALN